MLTMKNLNERLKKLETEKYYKIPNTKFIARVKVYKADKNYKEQIENLKKRSFDFINIGMTKLFLSNEIYEIWEKEYAEGEF